MLGPVAAIAISLTVAACGGGKHASAPSGSQPEGAARAAVRKAIDDSYEAFTRAEGGRLCRLMTPALRQQLLGALRAILPSLGAKPCAQAILAFYEHVPPRQAPQAMDESGAIAGDESFNKIRIDGSRATATFADGGTWAFQQTKDGWLIARFPFLPKGVPRSGQPLPPALSAQPTPSGVPA